MNEIKYTYRSIEEIMSSLSLYAQFSIVELILLIALAAGMAWGILYAIPAYKAIQKLKQTASEKNKRKLALKQIVIQKEVEEEIENELKLEAQQKMGK